MQRLIGEIVKLRGFQDRQNRDIFACVLVTNPRGVIFDRDSLRNRRFEVGALA
jgi:hypothetical protein